MENGIYFLNDTCLKVAHTLEDAVNSKSIQYKYYDVDCTELQKVDYLNNDIRQADWFQEIFKSYQGATVYAIEILSGVGNERILELYRDYIKTPRHERRGTSAIKRTNVIDSKYLYVGKVKAFFHGRVIGHLGALRSAQTVGLQIAHWLKGESLQLRSILINFHPIWQTILRCLRGKWRGN